MLLVVMLLCCQMPSLSVNLINKYTLPDNDMILSFIDNAIKDFHEHEITEVWV